ncbi:g9596 [Coccomyxa viridis]|uniref:G9596 protein n=1 Tax=Coccomyxa viridis TaxID=1274662 RepID=A0ABP1G7Y2_9CHLO
MAVDFLSFRFQEAGGRGREQGGGREVDRAAEIALRRSPNGRRQVNDALRHADVHQPDISSPHTEQEHSHQQSYRSIQQDRCKHLNNGLVCYSAIPGYMALAKYGTYGQLIAAHDETSCRTNDTG